MVPHREDLAMVPFERLERTTELIANHADYPGKQEFIAECLDEVEGLWRRGQLSLDQRFRLYAILLRGRAAHRRLATAV
jgi:hypothetical protein